MAFDVIAPTGTDTSTAPSLLTNLRPGNAIPAPAVVTPTRSVALYETTDAYDRITPLMGTPTSSAEFMDPITENIALGSTEVWQIFNTTADTHPIHLHQTQFQILTRQNFTTKLVNLGVSDSGVTKWGMSDTKLKNTPKLASGNEVSWKDTIQINPGEVITVRAKFDLPGKYVTHCHILSHEEHDMMRYMQIGEVAFPTPTVVVDATGTVIDPTAEPETIALVAVQSIASGTFSSQAIALNQEEDASTALVEQLLV
jgi:spore coat protein A